MQLAQDTEVPHRLSFKFFSVGSEVVPVKPGFHALFHLAMFRAGGAGPSHLIFVGFSGLTRSS